MNFFSISLSGTKRDHAPLVGNGPGAIAFTLIPYSAHSNANERVIARTPALLQAEGSTKAHPVLSA